VPAKFIGHSFDIFAKALSDLKRENIDIILISICRDGKVYLNSKIGIIDGILEGNDFFATCYTA
jgi:hypothetical protein